jgi:transposase InsO family protein
MDLFGSVTYLSIGGNKYGLVIVDDYSHFTWVFFMYDKSQVQEKVKIFIRKAQKEFDFPIKKVRSDNGTEFKTLKWKDSLKKRASSMNFQLHTPLNKMV